MNEEFAMLKVYINNRIIRVICRLTRQSSSAILVTRNLQSVESVYKQS